MELLHRGVNCLIECIIIPWLGLHYPWCSFRCLGRTLVLAFSIIYLSFFLILFSLFIYFFVLFVLLIFFFSYFFVFIFDFFFPSSYSLYHFHHSFISPVPIIYSSVSSVPREVRILSTNMALRLLFLLLLLPLSPFFLPHLRPQLSYESLRTKFSDRTHYQAWAL